MRTAAPPSTALSCVVIDTARFPTFCICCQLLFLHPILYLFFFVGNLHLKHSATVTVEDLTVFTQDLDFSILANYQFNFFVLISAHSVKHMSIQFVVFEGKSLPGKDRGLAARRDWRILGCRHRIHRRGWGIGGRGRRVQGRSWSVHLGRVPRGGWIVVARRVRCGGWRVGWRRHSVGMRRRGGRQW